ncbi:hypothetical protein [Parahaliea mediterranea]|uniref:hypothetical protein n=1 Tax=Parahaliea mediterranea TaxID=651086 RepID=UPI0013008926|nr:hypothetical protein [Parahaliea mediterranea]
MTLAEAVYIALDKLEQLDPATVQEPWFRLIEKTVDKVIAANTEYIPPTMH